MWNIQLFKLNFDNREVDSVTALETFILPHQTFNGLVNIYKPPSKGL